MNYKNNEILYTNWILAIDTHNYVDNLLAEYPCYNGRETNHVK